jgi:5'-methylthioinosine phosphorylase
MPRHGAATRPVYAIIAGSGFDAFGRDGESRAVATRFGEPSAPVRTLRFHGSDVLVMLRHGDDHRLPPHAINYAANLQALKECGATSIVAINTVGAVSARCSAGQLAVPEQLIDYTWGRRHTIHDGNSPAFEHVDFTAPFSPPLRSALLAAAAAAGVDCYDGGVYAVTQGPRLETAAEIDRLERDGADFVGMTAMPEAGIACELGLEYACLSLVVNAAAGRGEKPIHEDVESSTLSARLQAMQVLRQFFGK